MFDAWLFVFLHSPPCNLPQHSLTPQTVPADTKPISTITQANPITQVTPVKSGFSGFDVDLMVRIFVGNLNVNVEKLFDRIYIRFCVG